MVYISGMGMISALGETLSASWNSILESRHGLGYATILDTRHRNDLCIGEIKLSNAGLAGRLKLSGDGYSRTALLGIHALKEALQGIPEAMIQSGKTAFINATTVGGMSDVENLYAEMIDPEHVGQSMAYVNSLDCADCTMRMSACFGIKGFQATISTACSSSANAILMGARMIAAGECDMAICGGTDALTRFTLNGFNALKNVDKIPCRPFDQNRNGLNLGEAAAYIVLVNERVLKQYQMEAVAVFKGYGNTNEAHHPTAPSPDGKGALLTMQQALRHAGLSPVQIGYVNAHGTATLGNDLSEGNAIRDLFGADFHNFSSTKAYTGHTLAASGAVEAILSCLSLKHQVMPPNLRFETPMEEAGLRPVTSLTENPGMTYALSNSFGFGGNNVSLVFGKI